MRSLATLGALLAIEVSDLVAVLRRTGVRERGSPQAPWLHRLYQAGKAAAENLATAHLNRANIHARRRKYALAFADYASAIVPDPRNPLIAYNRGNAHLDTRRYELAVADYSRAIELDADFALAYLNRGIAHERLGEARSAADDIRRALAVNPALGAAQRRLKRLPPR
jgi:tetratricopeptide (TPR) repeat protein